MGHRPAMKYGVGDLQLLFRAIQFAAEKHRNQRRKDATALPYINHPIKVVTILWEIGEVREISVLVGALLHDTIEDTQTTFEEIKTKFGKSIAELVQEVTDDKWLPKQVRKNLQVRHASEISRPAALIKLADKIANVEDIRHLPPKDWSLKRKQEYIDWAVTVVEKLNVRNQGLLRYFHSLVNRHVV